MKARIIFTLCIFLGTFPVFAQSAPVVVTPINNGFTVSFTLPSYTLRDTTLTGLFNTSEIFKYVKLDGFGVIDDIGYPQLPQYSFDLHIPTGASDFAVASSHQATQVVSLNRRALPTQTDFNEDSSLPLPLELNQLYYASNGSLYNFTNKISDPYIVFGEQGITMSVFPFLYNPQANSLTVVNSVTFTVTYTPTRGGSGNVRASTDSVSRVKEDFLSAFFANYAPTRGGTSFGGRYLIIAHSSYVSTLATFVSYKQALGYQVTLVNTSSIPNGTTSSGIKTYLRNLYASANRPDFVLLVGNHSQVPASAGDPTGSSDYNPITDLHYACMTDNILIPVAILGRFPVSSTAELQRIIEKTMFMESNIHNFPKKAKFVAGSGSGSNSFETIQNNVIKNTFNGLGYNSQKLYQTNETNVRNAINDNPLYFVYRGHGHITWMAVNSPFGVTSSFLTNAATTNTIYPFVFSFSCLTGNFAHPTSTCIGTSWLTAQNNSINRGGVSYFGASVSTNRHTNNVIQENIFGGAFTSQERLGAITTLGLLNYGNRFWALANPIRTNRHRKAYNLLGDPSLNIHGNGWTIIGPSVVNTNNSTFTLSGNLQATNWIVSSGFTIVSQNATSAIVNAAQPNNQAGVLTAVVNGAKVIKNIIASSTVINGSNAICLTGSYSLSTGQSAKWVVSSGFSVSPSTGTSTTVSAAVPHQYNGLLSAEINGVKFYKNITTCNIPVNNIYISGPDIICPSSSATYTLVGWTASNWVVAPSPTFNLVFSNSTTAVVATNANQGQSGAIVAIVHGQSGAVASIVKPINACGRGGGGSSYIIAYPNLLMTYSPSK